MDELTARKTELKGTDWRSTHRHSRDGEAGSKHGVIRTHLPSKGFLCTRPPARARATLA